MPRMMVGLVKTLHQNSNAAEANDEEGIDALFAQAADCMNNADAVLAENGYVDADLATV